MRVLNDPRLSDKDLATIAAWVDGGAVEGDARDLPALPRFTEGWHIGTPNVVLSMSTVLLRVPRFNDSWQPSSPSRSRCRRALFPA